ncbi:hypothetical protein [Parvibaculum sp.]|uniref:hypothetical protein n=1 Tax=Parvibaculum sp. TaxID=2024848 RepID=UPI0027348725|nr:hypothetical protein [Parvibaculum sp.]MDP3329444.1 hypothetical protein [Parvibaculum sp.]
MRTIAREQSLAVQWEGSVDHFALLFRLNSNHWKDWRSDLRDHPEQWFRTGRRRPQEISAGIPAIILGTGSLGLVGYGKTISAVHTKSDPNWHLAPKEHQDWYKQSESRVEVRIVIARCPLERLISNSVVDHIRRTRRETATWLTSEQYREFRSMMP